MSRGIEALLIASLLAVVGCNEPRGVTPPVTPVIDRTAERDQRFEHGQAVFMRFCNSCHPGTGSGLGPSLYERPLTRNMMAFQVRHGLGKMPAFDQSQISKQELADLVRYLDKVEDLDPEPPAETVVAVEW